MIPIVSQTKLAAAGLSLMTLSLTAAAFMLKKPLLAILTFIVAALVSILMLIGVNCTILGNCQVYAWIMAAVFLTLGFTCGALPFMLAVPKTRESLLMKYL